MTTISTSTSAFYERSITDLASLRSQAQDMQASLSSGQRLTTASDDPVAASRLRRGIGWLVVLLSFGVVAQAIWEKLA